MCVLLILFKLIRFPNILKKSLIKQILISL